MDQIQKNIWAVTGLASAVLGFYTLLNYSHAPKGYVGRAGAALAPLREKFQERCRSHGFASLHGGELAEIVAERDDFLRKQGLELGCEAWRCASPEDGEIYLAQITARKTCDYAVPAVLQQ